MRTILLSLAVVALTVFSAAADSGLPDEKSRIRIGQTVPEFTVELMDGSTVSMSELRDKVVVVNFWATWCPYCIQELAVVQEQIVDRFAGTDLVFIAIDRGEDRSKVEDHIEKTGYRFCVGLDPDQSIFGLFAENSIPRTYVIDRNGVIRASELGYSPETMRQLVEIIEATLN